MKEVAAFYEDFLKYSPTDPVWKSVLQRFLCALPTDIKLQTVPLSPKTARWISHWQRLVRQSFWTRAKRAALRRFRFVAKICRRHTRAAALQSDGTFKREFVNSIISVDYTGISNGTLYPAYFGDEVSFLSDGETIESYAATADKKRGEPSFLKTVTILDGIRRAVYARLATETKPIYV